MNVMNHTPLRELLEDAEARGSVDADEVEAAIAGLDLRTTRPTSGASSTSSTSRS